MKIYFTVFGCEKLNDAYKRRMLLKLLLFNCRTVIRTKAKCGSGEFYRQHWEHDLTKQWIYFFPHQNFSNYMFFFIFIRGLLRHNKTLELSTSIMSSKIINLDSFYGDWVRENILKYYLLLHNSTTWCDTIKENDIYLIYGISFELCNHRNYEWALSSKYYKFKGLYDCLLIC